MATRATNTQQEALQRILGDISQIKTYPDADLQYLVGLETNILGKLREPFEAMQGQLGPGGPGGPGGGPGVGAPPGMPPGLPPGMGPGMPPPGMGGPGPSAGPPPMPVSLGPPGGGVPGVMNRPGLP